VVSARCCRAIWPRSLAATGIAELVAEVLPDNPPMLEVFEHSGFLLTSRRKPEVVHVTLRLG
jgi:hypothetical protein